MEDLTEVIALVDSTPASYFTRGVKTAESLREALEKLYFIQSQANTAIKRKLKKGRPARLKCEGLEGEQVWSMLQIWDKPVMEWVETMTDSLAAAEDDIHLLEASENEDDEEGLDGDEDEMGFGEDDFDEGDFGEDEEEREGFGSDDEEGFFGDRTQSDKDAPLSDDVDPELDDEHFRVAEMDLFSDQLETQMMKEFEEEEKQLKRLKEKGKLDDEDEDDDDDDMDSYDSEQELDDMKHIKRSIYSKPDEDEDEDEGDDDDEDDAVNLRYDSFFDPPPGERAKVKGQGNAKKAPTSQVSSKRAKAKAELAKRIAELEAENIGEKPWDLRGETKAASRPKDSLLAKEDIDVDFLKRATPALTPEVASQIEDVILKRYFDQKFDDPIVLVDENGDRKASAVTGILSKEKSKEGLADIYAKDYAEKVLDHTPKEKLELDKERGEIKELFERLCFKLDALSNLSFTPKLPPTINDPNRPPDVATVHMEDIAPTTETGEVSQAAPQDLQKKTKGLGKSKKEMEPEERRALRRRHKEADRAKKRAAGIIRPVAPAEKKKVKVTEAADKDGQNEVRWTSSTQVFRKLSEKA